MITPIFVIAASESGSNSGTIIGTGAMCIILTILSPLFWLTDAWECSFILPVMFFGIQFINWRLLIDEAMCSKKRVWQNIYLSLAIAVVLITFIPAYVLLELTLLQMISAGIIALYSLLVPVLGLICGVDKITAQEQTEDLSNH